MAVWDLLFTCPTHTYGKGGCWWVPLSACPTPTNLGDHCLPVSKLWCGRSNTLAAKGSMVHPKLHNINSQNVTRSLISQNPREWMLVVQISLLIVTFLSLISQNLSLMQATKEVNPRPRIAPCVNMWSVTFFFFLFFF